MTHFEKASKIVEAYCEQYGLCVEDIKKRHGKKYIAKVVKGQNTAIIRMVLAYYLTKAFPFIYQRHISDLLGYKDRSVISTHNDDVHQYLRNGDSYTSQYWNKLLEMVRGLNILEDQVAA